MTVYTGKVEVGQNVRTSLSQVVAEELRLPVESVRLVMGDTDRVPFDMGTFGSNSTPGMAPQLQRVAAAARELLLDLAGEQMKSERGALVLADGKIIDPQMKKSMVFGELTKGQKLTKAVAADVALARPADWKVIGTSVPKVDGRAIVTGRHKYSSDVKLPGMLHGKVLRSPKLGGTLGAVDLKAAEALPAVVAVHDGQFVGVAAPTEQMAERALAAIKAEWSFPDQQPSGKDLFEKMRADRAQGPGLAQGGRGRNSNRGSIERGMAEADHKIEAAYTIAYIAHAPLETRAAVAEWKDDKVMGLDRHPTPVWRSRRAGRRFPPAARARAGDRPRYRVGLRRETHRADCRRSRAPRQSRRPAGEARVDPRRRVHLGVFPSGRSD